MIGEHGCAREQLAVEGRQSDRREVVLVCRGGDLSADLHLALKFFDDFPFEGLSWGLAGFDLSPGELPLAGKAAVGTTPSAEHGILLEDDCAHDADLFAHDHTSQVLRQLMGWVRRSRPLSTNTPCWPRRPTASSAAEAPSGIRPLEA